MTTPEEIDITNAGQLRAALLHAAGRPGPAVVVDMTRTRFCDSAGLHALIGAHRRARTEGCQVRLAVTGPQVRRLIALTALDRLVPVYLSLDQALAHLPVAPSRAARDQGRQQQARARQAAGLTEHAMPGSGRRIRPPGCARLRCAGRRGGDTMLLSK